MPSDANAVKIEKIISQAKHIKEQAIDHIKCPEIKNIQTMLKYFKDKKINVEVR